MLGLVADYGSDEEDADTCAPPSIGFKPGPVQSESMPTSTVKSMFGSMPSSKKKSKHVFQVPAPKLATTAPDEAEMQALERELLEKRAKKVLDRKQKDPQLSWLPPPKRHQPPSKAVKKVASATSEAASQGDMKVPAKVALAASASDTSQPPAKRIKAAQFTFSTSKAKPRDSLAQPPSAASVPSPPPSQPTCSTTPAAPLLEPTMLKIARTQEACQAQTSFPSSAHSHAIPSTASFLASAAMGPCEMAPPSAMHSSFSPALSASLPTSVRRELGGGNIIDVSAEDIMARAHADPEAMAQSAMATARLQKMASSHQPDKKMRRKHQIGFLAYQADLDEMEVDARVGAAYSSKGATAAKYGW
jgi:hypothetical protein